VELNPSPGHGLKSEALTQRKDTKGGPRRDTAPNDPKAPKSPLALIFGENLSQGRRRSGISQEELAVRASLHRTEIGLLERGERLPRIDTAIKLASALGVPVSDLLAGIDWQPGRTHRGEFLPTPEAAARGGNEAGSS
jgi:DNA-binding XRE family transcriptional regulator